MDAFALLDAAAAAGTIAVLATAEATGAGLDAAFLAAGF